MVEQKFWVFVGEHITLLVFTVLNTYLIFHEVIILIIRKDKPKIYSLFGFVLLILEEKTIYAFICVGIFMVNICIFNVDF